jgi:hypothetical protein
MDGFHGSAVPDGETRAEFIQGSTTEDFAPLLLLLVPEHRRVRSWRALFA